MFASRVRCHDAGMTKQTTTPTAALTASLVAIAACSMAVTSANEIQLLPAGEFRARDGRPSDAPCWRSNADTAAALIAAANARLTPYVIDYEHATLIAKRTGQPAPAAGWYKNLEWREGVGLFATDVKWTASARTMIDKDEYRYISPVIGYDKATGNVVALYMAALTNDPAIDGMDEAILAAASAQFSHPTPLTQEIQMDELLQQLIWLLNLPVGSTPDDVKAQLQKLIDMIKQSDTGTAAANFDLIAHLQAQRTTITALSTATPDPAKYVPIKAVQDLQAQVAALTAQTSAGRVDELVKEALSDGRLVPSLEPWARDFGAKDLAGLSSYLDAAPKIVSLSSTQTNGKPPIQTAIGSLTDNQVALCNAMGISQEDFLKTLKAEQQA